MLKTIARRGAAKAKLGQLASAAEDYRVAAALDPSDADLKRDYETLVKRCEEEEGGTEGVGDDKGVSGEGIGEAGGEVGGEVGDSAKVAGGEEGEAAVVGQ